ncbi:aminoglycoside phosphotransferase family protein [Myxococcota bacterium]|nr:aminoglycoside phosphotransferase family protein [Myxococcota bacterium]
MSNHRSHLRVEAKADFEDRMTAISSPDFVDRVIQMIPRQEGSAEDPGVCRIRKIQNDGTGPATLEYRFKNGPVVFGKLYRDESGEHCHRVLSELWSDGFGGNSSYQVVRPLAFFPDLNLMYTLGAPGNTVSSALPANGKIALEGVRESAHWLSRLHASHHRIGKPDTPWYVFLKLADRLSKAAAANPKQLKLLKTVAVRLREAQESQVHPVIVQGHGQFRPIHVFRDTKITSVIDLDRSRPADPGRDLSEFVHRMRSHVFRGGGNRKAADKFTECFLDEYMKGPATTPGNFRFYLGFNVAVSMCRHLKKSANNKKALKRDIDFYEHEFDKAISGSFLP